MTKIEIEKLNNKWSCRQKWVFNMGLFVMILKCQQMNIFLPRENSPFQEIHIVKELSCTFGDPRFVNKIHNKTEA